MQEGTYYVILYGIIYSNRRPGRDQRGENMQAEILSIMHAEKSADTVCLDFRQKPRPGAIDFLRGLLFYTVR